MYINSIIDKNTNIKNEKQNSNHGLDISKIEIFRLIMIKILLAILI